MRNVLVPLDGTKRAENVLAFIGEVCSPGDNVVLLLVKKTEQPDRVGSIPGRAIRGGSDGPFGGVAGVVSPDTSVYQETNDQVFQRQTNEGRDYLEERAIGLRQAGFDVAIAVLIRDDAAPAILDYARKMRPTFIVMQRRTHFDLKDRFLGNVAKQVMEIEVAPVLFVPPVQCPAISV